MHKQSDHHESKAASVDWDSIPALKWTGKKAELFWEWFLEASGISKDDFLKELEVDNKPANAIDRLFAKMNESEAMLRKELSSAKGGGTQESL